MPVPALWLSGLTLLVVAIAGLVLAWRLCSWLGSESRRQRQDLSEQINRLLPQTQCGQCGYSGCAPYAQALAGGDAINRCPPGGERTIQRLAELLQRPVVRLDPTHGIEQPARIAFIHEEQCIGCTKCIQACPVDAILGAPKFMHTVIARECTGCELCVEPCPVDCIDLLPMPTVGEPHWQMPERDFFSSSSSEVRLAREVGR
ncbi:MAG: electron transport complex subunit RsxB [Pseudomonadales bacterium]|nr:electron transport complex subunit RsxB [Pseudomonadales bacterium]